MSRLTSAASAVMPGVSRGIDYLASPIRNSRAAIPSGRVGGGDDQAAASRCRASGRRTAPGRRRPGRWSARPEARSAAARREPCDRKPPPLSGRQIGRRQAGGVIEPDGFEACGRVGRRAAEKIPPEEQVFQHRSEQASARRGDRDNGPVRPASVRGRRPRARSIRRPAARSAPRSAAAARFYPAHWRPVTASASPAPTAKSRPENTSRPPRTHLTPHPESRILAAIRRLSHEFGKA